MTLANRCRLITALILDVDGVLTSGEIVYTAGTEEIKAFHVRDGSGIKLWQKTGHQIGILSGRTSAVTSHRARELGIELVEQGSANKCPGFSKLLQLMKVDHQAVAYIGDDLPDIPLLKKVGLAVTPADACPEARRVAHLVTNHTGGQGAVREAIEWILHSQNQWLLL